MTPEERSVIIGLWRQGNTFETIGTIMGINEGDAEQIIFDYMLTNGRNDEE